MKNNFSNKTKRQAFTLIELVVVIATLGLFTMVMFPLLANTQPANAKSYQCLNNMRQLAQAWTLYAQDNHEQMAINSDPHVNNTTLYQGGQSWVTGSLDWSAGQQNTNTSYLTADVHSLLGAYEGRSTRIFACPAIVTFLSTAQRSVGFSQRSRSVAMNGAVGDGDKFESPQPFGWTNWYVAKKTTDFHTPSPGNAWVFIDEHPDSLDDALIYTSSYPGSFITELPGSQHEGGCGVTFADAHCETHKWGGIVCRKPVTFALKQELPCPTGDPDMLWLAQRTPRN